MQQTDERLLINESEGVPGPRVSPLPRLSISIIRRPVPSLPFCRSCRLSVVWTAATEIDNNLRLNTRPNQRLERYPRVDLPQVNLYRRANQCYLTI